MKRDTAKDCWDKGMTAVTGAREGTRRDADRDIRLAAALRANLARRKAQSRARKANPQSDDPAED